MPYVPGFDYDIFISYATQDNDGDAVVEFVAAVEKHLTDNLVNFASPKEKVKIYFDRKRLGKKTAVNWMHELEAASKSSALLVPLVSPNYLSSPICAKELDWFSSQPHAPQTPAAVVGWRALDGTPLPPELDNLEIQRHPPGEDWLTTLTRPKRKESTHAFALKLRDRLKEMRNSVVTVFLGPAEDRTVEVKKLLRDELEKAGYRVVPEAEYLYRNDNHVKELLRSALLAVHFLGGASPHAIPVMAESFRSLPKKTIILREPGLKLSPDEETFLAEDSERLHNYVEYRTTMQLWNFILEEVHRARFRQEPHAERVGVACHELDLPGAKTVAALIGDAARVPIQWPPFEPSGDTTDNVRAFRQFTGSSSILYYWATVAERPLKERLKPALLRKYKAEGWYLAPPLGIPGKDSIKGLVMRQVHDQADLETLRPFLEKLGWRPE